MQQLLILVATISVLLPMASAVAEFRTIRVTNLNESGPGSLRACVDAAGARACIFDVSGRISLSRPLDIKHGELVLAGQTAPSPGVLLTGAPIRVQATNVNVEHLEIRVGDAKGGPDPIDRDCVSVLAGSSNVVLRHLSLSWAVDENFSTWGRVTRVRVEDSIVAEALHRSIHPEGAHSMGALVGKRARRVSFVGNLFAANHDRNVRWMPNTSGEMVGNVIYGWGGSASNATNLSYGSRRARPISLDIVGNVYLPGPLGNPKAFGVYAENAPPGTRVYLDDNLAPRVTNLTGFNLSPVRILVGGSPQRQPAGDTLLNVIKRAGSRSWERNEEDIRIISGMLDRTLSIRSRVGGWPTRKFHRRSVSAPARFSSEGELRAWLNSFESSGEFSEENASSIRSSNDEVAR